MRLGSVWVEVVRGARDGGRAVAVETLGAVAHAVDAAVGWEVLLHRGLQRPRVLTRELGPAAHAATHGRHARLHVHLLRGVWNGTAGWERGATRGWQPPRRRAAAAGVAAHLDAVDARRGERRVQRVVERGGARLVLDQAHTEEGRGVPCDLRKGGG